jgi:hypothetical protein
MEAGSANASVTHIQYPSRQDRRFCAPVRRLILTQPLKAGARLYMIHSLPPANGRACFPEVLTTAGKSKPCQYRKSLNLNHRCTFALSYVS